MKKIFVILAFCKLSICSFAQTNVDSLISYLSQSDFHKIYLVSDKIINEQKKSIPSLIKLLTDTTFSKLTNTADLIYPGAETFYGHGWIVNYDLDWICIRSAWLLEQITFENFGFKEIDISEDDLFELHKKNHTEEYLQKDYHDIDYKTQTPREKLKIYRLMLADSVDIWWTNNKENWNRCEALKNALSSNDEYRQSLALDYLRHEKTYCDSLTLEKYKTEIQPLIIKIKESKNSNSEQAEYMLEDDDDDYWFNIKQKKK